VQEDLFAHRYGIEDGLHVLWVLLDSWYRLDTSGTRWEGRFASVVVYREFVGKSELFVRFSENIAAVFGILLRESSRLQTDSVRKAKRKGIVSRMAHL
jgi:hypothetical protein